VTFRKPPVGGMRENSVVKAKEKKKLTIKGAWQLNRRKETKRGEAVTRESNDKGSC